MSTPPPSLLVADPVTPMFREPDPLSEQVSQALLSMPVALLEERGEWARFRTPDSYEGWGRRASLSPPPPGWHAPSLEVSDRWANLRARADYRQAAVTRAPIGARLPRTDEADGWVELLLPDGRRLWTEAHRVRHANGSPSRSRAAIARTARSLLGVPYLWGGNSPDGLDCSGFIQLVLRLHGILLRRDAGMQFEQGVAAPEPQAADLVFFGPIDTPHRITHVGMMLDPRRFIHAKGSDHVRIDLLHGDSYAAAFRGARRFV